MKHSSLWTALYGTPAGLGGCYWLKIGHSKGPKISLELALKIGRNFIKGKKDWEFIDLRPYGPDKARWRRRS